MHGIEGTVVGGDFRVERLLGRGGMGSVYVALQLSTSRRRALKLMAPDLAKDPRSVDRDRLAVVGMSLDNHERA